MEYALVYWLADKTTSIVKKSALLTSQIIGETSMVCWDNGDEHAEAFEAKIVAISKNQALLEEKADHVVVEPDKKSNTSNKRAAKRRRRTGQQEMTDSDVMKSSLKKSRLATERAKNEHRISTSLDILNLCNKEDNEILNTPSTSITETMTVINTINYENDEAYNAEVVNLRKQLDTAKEKIAELTTEIVGLRADVDASCYFATENMLLKDEKSNLQEQINELKMLINHQQAFEGNTGVGHALPFPASPLKAQFLRRLADHIDKFAGQVAVGDAAQTSNGINDMVELEENTKIFLRKVDRATIILKSRGDPGIMVAMTLEKLFTPEELANMSANGKRRDNAIGRNYHDALIAFLESNSSPERLKGFDFVKALKNKFGSARRSLKQARLNTSGQIAQDGLSTTTPGLQQINS